MQPVKFFIFLCIFIYIKPVFGQTLINDWNTINYNVVYSPVYQEYNGRVYVGESGSLYSIDTSFNNLIRHEITNSGISFSNTGISFLMKSEQNYLYATSYGSPLLFKFNGNFWNTVPVPLSSNNYIKDAKWFAGKAYIYENNVGIHIYDEVTGLATLLTETNSNIPFNSANTFSSIQPDSSGNIWFACKLGSLNKIGRYNGVSITYFDSTNSVLTNGNVSWGEMNFFEGKIWVANIGGGLFSYDGSSWTRYTQLVGTNITTLYNLRNSHNGWLIASNNQYLFRCQGGNWIKDTLIGLPSWYYAGDEQTGYVDSQGRVWYQTYRGLFRKTGLVTNYKTQSYPGSWTYLIKEIPGKGIYTSSMLRAKNNQNFSPSLTAFNYSFQPKPYKYSTQNLPDVINVQNFTSNYFEITDTAIYTFGAGAGGFFVLKDSSYQRFTSSNSLLPSNPTVKGIAGAANGKIYSICNNTIYEFDGIDFNLLNSGNSPLTATNYYSILADENEVVWITSDSGFYSWDGTIWNIFNSSNTPSSTNFSGSLALQQNGKILVAADNGLLVKSDTGFVLVPISPVTGYNRTVPVDITEDSVIWFINNSSSLITRIDSAGNVSLFNSSNSSMNCLLPENLLIDKYNNVWVSGEASAGSSLSVFNENGLSNAFDHYSGSVYFDRVNDSIFNSNDLLIPNKIVGDFSNSYFTATNLQGKYYIPEISGNQIIQPQLANYQTISQGNNGYQIPSDTIMLDSLDFGIHCDTMIFSVFMNSSIPRCNSLVDVWIQPYISGVPADSIITTLSHNPVVNYITSTIFPEQISGNQIRWKQSGYNGYYCPSINASFQFPGAAYINDTMNFSVISVAFYNGYPDTAVISVDPILICAYDPNDKQVNPPGIDSLHVIARNQNLNYTIRFQNTGTDTVFSVRVFDMLSNSLDFSTLEIISSSHPFVFHYSSSDRTMIFEFNNILLPDSSTNYIGSQGYISYSINPYSNLNDSTTIYNSSAIYFDYNEPVITNTVFSTIIDNILEIHEIKHEDIIYCFPNPTTDILNVYYPGSEALSFEIISINGRKLINGKLFQGINNIDLSAASTGVYVLQFTEKINKPLKIIKY